MNSLNENNYPYLLAFGQGHSEIKYYFIVVEKKNLIAVSFELGIDLYQVYSRYIHLYVLYYNEYTILIHSIYFSGASRLQYRTGYRFAVQGSRSVWM